MAEALRRAAVAGSWYPGTAGALRREVEGHLSAADGPAPPGALVGLISPHAGIMYSGPVAAFGYRLLRGRPATTVVLVGPSHRALFDGVAVYGKGAFETPLGEAAVDEELARALTSAHPKIRHDTGPHAFEHSLEMQLPFLQHVMPGLRIVPMLLGTQARSEVDALAGALAQVLAGRDALLVASSDLSHYHSSREAAVLDAKVVAEVEAFDDAALMARLESYHGHACGGGAMVAVMAASRALGAREATVLRYADSGDVPEGDKSRVVGYLSAAFTR
ncbi:MAG TPA: AmmeMemoRadiSam system protein B [Vicinamibacteria bacterium]|jgi:AmmeMemoRadiSam system protein B